MELHPLYVGAFAVGTTLGMLLLLRAVFRRQAAEAGGHASRLDENPAQAALLAGQLVAVFLVAASSVSNSLTGQGLLEDAARVAAFGLAALALLLITSGLGIALLLRSGLAAEVERRNLAAGVAGGAHYIACGVVTAEAFAGHDLEGLGLSLAFFSLAQVTLLGCVSLFRALTTYDDAEEIRGENVAAALAYGGVAIAVAIVVGHALEGDFEGWRISLQGYALALPWLLALYPVRQLFLQSLLLGAPLSLRGGPLDEAIQAKRSAAMGALEAATYVATALAVTRLFQ
jgi:uncharacterized membrane protein YjfL (UPF0719 family)